MKLGNVVISGSGSVSISPAGLHVPIPDTDAVIKYDAKTRKLEIEGLKETDRVILRCDNRTYSQQVSIEFK
ncbi:hypothetical protein SEQ_HALENA_74 [Mycobacterium phage Halena]|uniref:Uncharacterized protein n=5 Tax=Bronvirus TaxID=1623278 RepID=A0A411BPH6_9CAUD|nr:hypothetical protein KNU44_gp073 [Mycobacterium phage CicholasNage]AEK07609.1 hypothetical protein UPIE_75 [Mycobacterium phage UPIE]AEZ50753.1 hypothetical protein [Mycobacterium phage Fezzik]AYD82254.1 hypothetical protein SEA_WAMBURGRXPRESS_76 [Mycobacterium phage Wamburgrxpress]AZS12230.1 hypothetical protein SEA_ACQUIRE49_76 [Mycobacterium phage Acquire49]QBP29856.1 hypothetical protein SEQ_HALENA_74 [Mycobacterium phage Halena]QDK04079.1 hypothetical protein SEA_AVADAKEDAVRA_76 [Myco